VSVKKFIAAINQSYSKSNQAHQSCDSLYYEETILTNQIVCDSSSNLIFIFRVDLREGQ